MDCQHLDDLYELYLLGLGGPGGAAEIDAHVERGCPYCRERLREATQVVYFITHNVRPMRPVRPSPEMRAELLRRARKLRSSD